jgi:hypothetical protein
MCNRSLKILALAIAMAPIMHARDVALAEFSGILIPAKLSAPERSRVDDLAYHLAQVSGKEWPISETKSGRPIEIVQLTEEGSGEQWKIDISPDRIVLAGGSRGLGYATSVFLEKYCGVRWLWPGKSGEVIPKNPGLKFPAVSEGGIPRFVRRDLKFMAYPKFWAPECRDELALWAQRTRQANPLRTNFGHAWGRIMPPGEYFESHPEWYALVAGKRNSAQLCVSNPALRDQFFKNFVALADKTGLEVESISANDGYGFCECELCTAKGSIGDAYWDFVNDMATRYLAERPGRGVGTFAYTVGREPPAKIDKLPPNVFVSMTAYATSSMVNPAGRKEFEDFLQRWSSKGVRIMLREYWGMHYWLDLPVLVPAEIGFEMDTSAKSSVVGAYGECGKNFATMALNYYVVLQKLWSPERPLADILNEFYAAFGPSGKPVRAYLERLTKATHDYWQDKPFDSRYVMLISTYDNIFNPATLAAAAQDLESARKAAGDDKMLLEKIAFLQLGLDYTVVMTELLGLYEKLGATGVALEGFEWQSTAKGARAVLKSPDFTENRDFFEPKRMPPDQWTLADQDRWLKRAWELGQERIRLLNRARKSFALDEGLLAMTYDRKIRRWHQTVGSLLGIPVASIEPLQATGDPQP